MTASRAKFGSEEHRAKLAKSAAKGRASRDRRSSKAWGLRLPELLRTRIERRAASLGVSASEYVRAAIILMLERGQDDD